MPQDTSFLVRAARNGDNNALEELFDRYLPRISRIASIRMGCRLNEFADYEDIVQESLLQAFLHLPKLELKHDGAFLNWLASIVENNIRDHRRLLMAGKRGSGRVRQFATMNSTFLADALGPDDTPTPSQVVIADELEEQLETALLQLGERHRRVIDLRRLCGLNYKEVATEMELGSEASARSLFARALNNLACLL